MSNIELSIPADLTAAQIRRANPEINEETAQELAGELHDMVGCIQRSCAARSCEESSIAFEEIDVIETLLRTAVGIWPSDSGAVANESIWMMEMLRLAGGHELYLRYMRLSDRVNGTDLVTEFDLEH